MIPKLYISDGPYGTSRTLIGNISHCSRCICKEVLNGEYLLELTTDTTDFTNGYISTQNIIGARPNPFDSEQFFVIYKTERLINGKINVYAEHIRSLCNQYVTQPTGTYTEGNEQTINTTPRGAWREIISYLPLGEEMPFNFSSDITTLADYYLGLSKAETIGNILGGAEGSFLDTWHGEYYYNNFDIHYNKRRGRSQDYELRYGKNISEATQTEDTSNIYTHILPYGSVQDVSTGDTLIFTGPVVPIRVTESKFRKTFLWDCSEKSRNLKVYSRHTDTVEAGRGFSEAGEKMAQYALSFAQKQNLGSTLVSINVTHRSELNEMKKIALGDTVKVILNNYGTVTTAKITEAEYDVLNERWNSLQVGEQKVTLASLFLNRSKYLQGKF